MPIRVSRRVSVIQITRITLKHRFIVELRDLLDGSLT